MNHYSENEMAEKYEKNKKLFDEINALYEEYANLVGRENVENEKTALRTRIIIALCEILSLAQKMKSLIPIKLSKNLMSA